MDIEKTINNAWQQQSIWLWLFLPLSWLYGLIVKLRRQSYRLGIKKVYQAPVPVMVIGNITIGGSGKTPLIIALVNYLQQQQVKVGVISRGYGGNESIMPTLVNVQHLPDQVGDEPCMIVAQTGVALAVCPNRRQAIETLLAHDPDIELIIADDGLQHYALARDIEWIVVDEARGFGNQQLLPVGYLREPISRLKGATVIWHQPPSKVDPSADKLTMHLEAEQLEPLIDIKRFSAIESLSRFYATSHGCLHSAEPTKPLDKGQRVHAVSGIGYPKRFFDTLRALGFEIIEHPFPDHYAFRWADLLPFTEHPIIMTSKDAVKLRALALQALHQASAEPADSSIESVDQILSCLDRIWVLPVSAKLSADCYLVLNAQLAQLGVHLSSLPQTPSSH